MPFDEDDLASAFHDENRRIDLDAVARRPEGPAFEMIRTLRMHSESIRVQVHEAGIRDRSSRLHKAQALIRGWILQLEAAADHGDEEAISQLVELIRLAVDEKLPRMRGTHGSG